MKKLFAFLLKIRKEHIGRHPFLIKIYNKLNFHKRMEIQNLQTHGKEVIEQFDKCCKDNGYKYALAFGTLLGAIRDKGFIKTDDDIDMYMWIDDFTPEIPAQLQKYGFKWKHTFIADDQLFGREDTFSYKGIDLDIFYIYNSNEWEYPYCCDFPPHPDCSSRYESLEKYGNLISRQLFLPITKNFVEIDFLGLSIPIPENANEILEFRYGETFMTPIARWNKGAYSNEHITVRLDKEAVYITH
ncbi:MAG: LicD family protein [Prevotella sp.]|nr:LicD family protein [Prevotella sp.]